MIYSLNNERLGELLELVTVFPDDEADKKRSQNNPFIACEMLCESGPIYDRIIESTELLQKLFGFLDKESQHSTLLGYFSKAAVALLNRHPEKTVYFLSSQEYIPKLLNHIYSRSITDIVIKILTLDITSNDFIIKEQKSILTSLFSMLKTSSEYQTYFAAFILSDILNKAMEINSWKELIEVIVSDENLQILFDCLQATEKFRIVASASVLKTLFLVCIRVNLYVYYEKMNFMSIFINNLPNISKQLSQKSQDTIKNTLKEDVVPLGEAKLKIIELIAVSLKQDNEKIFKPLAECGILNEIVKLFFEYPWHSMLHTAVDSIFQSAFLYQNTVLIESLIVNSGFVEKMIESVKNIRINHRCGYLGHVNRVANALKETENESIREHLKKVSGWKEFVEDYLEERNVCDKKQLGEPGKREENLSSEGDEPELSLPEKKTQGFGYGASVGHQDEKDKNEDNQEETPDKTEENKEESKNFEVEQKAQVNDDLADGSKGVEESAHPTSPEKLDSQANPDSPDLLASQVSDKLEAQTEHPIENPHIETQEKPIEKHDLISQHVDIGKVTEHAISEISKIETVPETAKIFSKPGEISIPEEKILEHPNKVSPKGIPEKAPIQNVRISPKGIDRRSPRYRSPSNRQGMSPLQYSPSSNPEYNCTNFWKLNIIVDEIDDLDELDELDQID